jgi:hypothetical protein
MAEGMDGSESGIETVLERNNRELVLWYSRDIYAMELSKTTRLHSHIYRLIFELAISQIRV